MVSRKYKPRETVWAVVRVDEGFDQSTAWHDRITVKEVVRSHRQAEAEVSRLDDLNRGKKCSHFCTGTRLFPEGSQAGPGKDATELVERSGEARLDETEDGNLRVLTTENCNWDSFAEISQEWANRLAAEIVARTDGPDYRVWLVSYQGRMLRFVYNDFPNELYVEADDAERGPAIEQLHSILKLDSNVGDI